MSVSESIQQAPARIRYYGHGPSIPEAVIGISCGFRSVLQLDQQGRVSKEVEESAMIVQANTDLNRRLHSDRPT
jgi:hypothetical protein